MTTTNDELPRLGRYEVKCHGKWLKTSESRM
jgi:hypothetical protein